MPFSARDSANSKWNNFLLLITIPLIGASVDQQSLRHFLSLPTPLKEWVQTNKPTNKQIRIDRN